MSVIYGTFTSKMKGIGSRDCNETRDSRESRDFDQSRSIETFLSRLSRLSGLETRFSHTYGRKKNAYCNLGSSPSSKDDSTVGIVKHYICHGGIDGMFIFKPFVHDSSFICTGTFEGCLIVSKVSRLSRLCPKSLEVSRLKFVETLQSLADSHRQQLLRINTESCSSDRRRKDNFWR